MLFPQTGTLRDAAQSAFRVSRVLAVHEARLAREAAAVEAEKAKAAAAAEALARKEKEEEDARARAREEEEERARLAVAVAAAEAKAKKLAAQGWWSVERLVGLGLLMFWLACGVRGLGWLESGVADLPSLCCLLCLSSFLSYLVRSTD